MESTCFANRKYFEKYTETNVFEINGLKIANKLGTTKYFKSGVIEQKMTNEKLSVVGQWGGKDGRSGGC